MDAHEPRAIFVRHIRLATYQLERPAQPERLAQLLRTIPDAERMFLYASGYPRSDYEGPESVAARLPASWHRRVFVENAEEFYRWPHTPRPPAPTGERNQISDLRAAEQAPTGGKR